MTQKITIDLLTHHLKANDVPFEVIQNSEWMPDYKFASIKQLISKGIYFFDSISSVKNYAIEKSIIIASEAFETSNNLILVDNPQLVHYLINSAMNTVKLVGISASSKIDSHATIGARVYIGENCVIGNCVLEDDVVIKHNVVIEDNVTIKRNTFIDSNSVIGAGGLAWIWDPNGNRILQPQLGGVVVGENCIIATDVTIVRGSSSENTIIGAGSVIAHGTKIGHGTIVKENVHMANNVSLAGNAVIGERTFLGSACVVSSNVSVADNCIVGAGAVVNRSVEESFVTVAGVPAKIIKRANFENKPNGAPKPFKKK
jgi:UDP-3-O-[3-hydroxymyristoyl] glucosamine N-acyltransferase